MGSVSNVDSIAGGIAHELLHQLGYDHPNDDGTTNRGGPQRDSFIYAFGDCVQFDGAPLGATAAPVRFY
jgi:hypothetical protein